MSLLLRGLESVLFTFLFVGFIFNLKFKGLPPSFLITSSLLLMMACFYTWKGYPYPKFFIKPLVFLSFFIISVIVSLVINENIDGFLISIIVAILFLITIAPYAVLSYFKDREITIVKYIVFAGVVNAFFIVGMFFVSDFRDFYLSLLSKVDLLHVKGEDALNSLYAIRLIGLTGSATYGTAVVQIVIAFLFIFYLTVIEEKLSIFNFLIVSLLIFSAILSGRTAFVGLFFLIIYLCMTKKFSELLKIFVCFLLFFFLAVLASKLFLPASLYDFFEQWILEVFKFQGEIGSVEVNKSMLSVYSFSDFSAFGDFKWHADNTRNSYYMDTDIGWYRFMFAFGYVGLLLLMAFVMSFFSFRENITKLHFLIAFIVMFLFLVMFKAAVFFDFYMIFFILTILLFFLEQPKAYES